MTDPAPTGNASAANGSKADAKASLQLVVGKATDAYKPWQQIPAWVLGGAAIVGAAFLIAFPRHWSDAQARGAWAAIIIALFLAVLLSFRSAFTLNENGKGSGAGDGVDQAGGGPAAGHGAGAGAAGQGTTRPTPPAGSH